MSPVARRLGAFALALAATFGAAYAVGSAWPDDAPAEHDEHDMDDEHGDDHGDEHGMSAP